MIQTLWRGESGSSPRGSARRCGAVLKDGGGCSGLFLLFSFLAFLAPPFVVVEAEVCMTSLCVQIVALVLYVRLWNTIRFPLHIHALVIRRYWRPKCSQFLVELFYPARLPIEAPARVPKASSIGLQLIFMSSTICNSNIAAPNRASGEHLGAFLPLLLCSIEPEHTF